VGWNKQHSYSIRFEGECWDRLAKWPDGRPLHNIFDVFDETPDAKAIRQKLSDCEAAAPMMRRLSLKVSDGWFDLKDSLPVIFLPPLALLIVGTLSVLGH
jgi:hypothetical protein